MKTLLWIDDDEKLLDAAIPVFLTYGFVVHRASNTSRALSILRTEKLDGVLLDVRLRGGENGLELLEEIHRLYPSLKIAIFTGYYEYHDQIQAIDLGASIYFQKIRKSLPLDPEKQKSFFEALDNVFTLASTENSFQDDSLTSETFLELSESNSLQIATPEFRSLTQNISNEPNNISRNGPHSLDHIIGRRPKIKQYPNKLLPSWQTRVTIFAAVLGFFWLLIEPLPVFGLGVSILEGFGGWGYIALIILSISVTCLVILLQSNRLMGKVEFIYLTIILTENGTLHPIRVAKHMQISKFIELFLHDLSHYVSPNSILFHQELYDFQLRVRRDNEYVIVSSDQLFVESTIQDGDTCKLEGNIRGGFEQRNA